MNLLLEKKYGVSSQNFLKKMFCAKKVTKLPDLTVPCTANIGPVRIQYKCLVLIYVFSKINCVASLLPKQNYNVLSPNFHIHVSVTI
jgi:hypothetical protein